jgi:hypothetical protein
VSLPLFLQGLDDANFHLLNALADRPIRIAAIDVAGSGPKPCRVFEFNAVRVQSTTGSEARLQEGMYLDEVSFSNSELTIEHDIGGEEELNISIELSPRNWGRFFDCELPLFTDTSSIATAVKELCDGDDVKWRFLGWVLTEEA